MRVNFLVSSRSPYGYEFSVCSATPFELPETLKTNLTSSSFWKIELEINSISDCTSEPKLGSQGSEWITESNPVTGLLDIKFVQVEKPNVNSLRVSFAFKPAALQEKLFVAYIIIFMLVVQWLMALQ
jgi:hypothetical protein